jgi:C-terminal processing protease CtpA/Prc
VPAAEAVSEMFVEKGGIWKTEEREESDPKAPVFLNQYLWVDEKGAHREKKYSNRNKPEPSEKDTRADYLAGHKPVVLIVNGNSASGSEIVAGALGDSGIVVVGSSGDPARKENVGTYGKGTGQMIYRDFEYDGAVIATELHYKTPRDTWPGNSFDKRYGLRPDIVVNNPDGVEPGSPDDAQLAAARAEIESQLKGIKHKTVYQ